jgi:hypothetical protein
MPVGHEHIAIPRPYLHHFDNNFEYREISSRFLTTAMYNEAEEEEDVDDLNAWEIKKFQVVILHIPCITRSQKRKVWMSEISGR